MEVFKKPFAEKRFLDSLMILSLRFKFLAPGSFAKVLVGLFVTHQCSGEREKRRFRFSHGDY
jgi:hypothetical protein